MLRTLFFASSDTTSPVAASVTPGAYTCEVPRAHQLVSGRKIKMKLVSGRACTKHSGLDSIVMSRSTQTWRSAGWARLPPTLPPPETMAPTFPAHRFLGGRDAQSSAFFSTAVKEELSAKLFSSEKMSHVN